MSAASFSLGSSLRSALHIDAALALIETGNMIPPSITVQTLKHVLKLHCYELFSRNMKEWGSCEDMSVHYVTFKRKDAEIEIRKFS